MAFVFDPDGRFPSRSNPDMIDLEAPDADDAAWLRDIVEAHLRETDSAVAAGLLADWDHALSAFVKVMPREYKRVLTAEREALAAGTDPVEAVMASTKS